MAGCVGVEDLSELLYTRMTHNVHGKGMEDAAGRPLGILGKEVETSGLRLNRDRCEAFSPRPWRATNFAAPEMSGLGFREAHRRCTPGLAKVACLKSAACAKRRGGGS